LYKDAVATSPQPEEPPALRLPAWAWAALALALGFVYLRGIASDPLRREEVRLALVAEEMIHCGDFAVPRLLGEPDSSQPPLQSWLVVLFSGGQASHVGPLSLRLPSVLAVAATALVLARLGLGAGSGPHALPALVFLGFFVLPRYMRTGEPDLLGAFWVAAALAAFELGRRRGSGGLQWVLSQALVACAALTQTIAAVFFHAPALFTTWRRKLRLRPVALAAGLVLMVAIVAAWVTVYARTASTFALSAQLSSEIARRTTVGGVGDALRHVPRSLFLLLLTAAPASLVLLALMAPGARAILRGLLRDPWLALCAFAVAWAVLWVVCLPGAQPRDSIPALPAAATLGAAALGRLDRPARPLWPWAVLAAAWAAFVLLGPRIALLAPAEPRSPRLAGALVGVGLLAIAAAWPIARGFGVATASLLVAGMLYGLTTARVPDPRAARRREALAVTAEALAPYLRPEMPVVVRKGVDRELTWRLVHRLDRLVVERAPAPPYDLVTRAGTPVPNARFMFESGDFAVWRVRVPVRP
jgi:4-amino-4-deoxy-L-arabinose transferase-like glycosyltransferase